MHAEVYALNYYCTVRAPYSHPRYPITHYSQRSAPPVPNARGPPVVDCVERAPWRVSTAAALVATGVQRAIAIGHDKLLPL